jgi:hypothetical protein
MKYPTVTIGTTKLPWPALAAFLAAAPMLGVLGLRAMTHTPVAAPTGSEDIIVKGQFVPPAMPKLSPEAVSLQLTFDSECNQPFGPSPMVNKTPPKPVVKEPPPQPKPDEAPVAPGQPVTPPALTLTSIMGSTTNPVAMINGKVRKVGDQVGNGFSIVSIDPVSGKVEIAHRDGVQATLQLKNLRGGE